MEDARARDVVSRAMLAAIRDGHPTEWCRRKLVNPLRKLLAPPHNVTHIGAEVEQARAESAASLTKFCASCPLEGCKNKMEPPP